VLPTYDALLAIRATRHLRCLKKNMLPPIALALLLGVATGIAAADDDAVLIEAVRAGDRDAVARLLDRGADPNAAGERTPHLGKTALMWAAEGDDHELVRLLLARGASVEGVNPNGGSALMYAAVKGSYQNVALLLDHGANVNAEAKNGWSPLMLAVAKARADVVRLLIDRGADPDQADVHGWTPLMRAAADGRRELVELLLAADADPDVVVGSGVSARRLAAAKGHVEIVELLDSVARTSDQ
jgi:uncharacterized protein